MVIHRTRSCFMGMMMLLLAGQFVVLAGFLLGTLLKHSFDYLFAFVFG